MRASRRAWPHGHGGRVRTHVGAFAIAAALALLFVGDATRVVAQEAPRTEGRVAAAPTREELGRLLDAVVETTAREFWDKDRLEAVGWQARAAAVRESVLEAATLEEAARRINVLLGELQASHTVLLTPDEVDYYILLDVFTRGDQAERGSRRRKLQDLAAIGGRQGVRYAGIGVFTARIEGRDFVDAVLEGSPAERAGIKAGDEIVGVDGDGFHSIRSFRGKIGEQARIAVRRVKDGPVETLSVDVVRITPLKTFGEATRTSARVIERGESRVGYVHVWASVGDASAQALSDALEKLGVKRGVARAAGEDGTETKPEPGQPAGSRPLDALIVDMRGRIGGTAGNAGRYLEVLDPRGPRIRSRNKSQSGRAFTSLRGRTAVLIDQHTRSTGELFVHAYKRERQGPLIGTRTAGAVSAGTAFAMPGGNLLYLAVTGLEVDGDIVEGVGVAPDIEVPRPLPYAAGADPVLDAAVDHLARAAARGGPGKPDGSTSSQ
jgi:carboxyl-terminal processing protease